MNPTCGLTIVYGMISAVGIWPVAGLLAGVLGWPTAFKAMLWVSLSGYAMLLVRWSGKRSVAPLFPLALLSGAAAWPSGTNAFFFMLLGGLTWIRSGICFDRARFRAVIAEILTIAGGAGLVAMIGPMTGVTWSFCIWLFFLVQSLYFFMVPASVTAMDDISSADPFDRAHRHAQRILDG